MSFNSKQISQSSVNVPMTTVNETNRSGPAGSRTDLNNVMKQPFGPVIRTPGQQKGPSSTHNTVSQQPSSPVYQSNSQNNNNNNHNNPRSYDITKTVTSIVDTWEADLAKHVKRRPSGQFESCNFINIFV